MKVIPCTPANGVWQVDISTDEGFKFSIPVEDYAHAQRVEDALKQTHLGHYRDANPGGMRRNIFVNYATDIILYAEDDKFIFCADSDDDDQSVQITMSAEVARKLSQTIWEMQNAQRLKSRKSVQVPDREGAQ